MRCGPNVKYCPTARNFYFIRRTLMEALGLPRGAIRPTSTWAELIPPRKRQHVQKLFLQQNMRVFDLTMSRLQSAIGCFVPVVVLLCGVVILPLVGFASQVCLALVGSLIAAVCTHLVLLDRATQLSPTFTVRHAVGRITGMCDYQKAGYELSSRDKIFLRVCEIVADNAGVDPKMLTEDTNFQEDLGLD